MVELNFINVKWFCLWIGPQISFVDLIRLPASILWSLSCELVFLLLFIEIFLFYVLFFPLATLLHLINVSSLWSFLLIIQLLQILHLLQTILLGLINCDLRLFESIFNFRKNKVPNNRLPTIWFTSFHVHIIVKKLVFKSLFWGHTPVLCSVFISLLFASIVFEFFRSLEDNLNILCFLRFTIGIHRILKIRWMW
jgi:hypothetical protein